MERIQRLLEMRTEAFELDASVFFTKEDEALLKAYDDKKDADEKKERENSLKRTKEYVWNAVETGGLDGNPMTTLQDLEDYAMGEGLDPDDVELIFHGLI